MGIIDTVVYISVGLVLYLLIANIRAILNAKKVCNYLESVSYKADVDLLLNKKVTSELYFNHNTVFVVSVSLLKEGIHIFSPMKISIILPWEYLSAIRIVQVNGALLANLRVLKEGAIDRSLTIPWTVKFCAEIPESVLLIDKN